MRSASDGGDQHDRADQRLDRGVPGPPLPRPRRPEQQHRAGQRQDDDEDRAEVGRQRPALGGAGDQDGEAVQRLHACSSSPRRPRRRRRAAAGSGSTGVAEGEQRGAAEQGERGERQRRLQPVPERRAPRPPARPAAARRRSRRPAARAAGWPARRAARRAASTAGAARNSGPGAVDELGRLGVGAGPACARTRPTGSGPCSAAVSTEPSTRPASTRSGRGAVGQSAVQERGEGRLLADEPEQRRQPGHRRRRPGRRRPRGPAAAGPGRRAGAGRGCPVAWSMTPTVRKSVDLNSACATSIASPAAASSRLPAPTSTMRKPSWLTVPKASSSLRSFCRSAR